MKDSILNILIVGLGGQGVIFASEIIAQIFISKNLVVKKSEIHGLSQRGGPVASHLRVGKEIFSPVIPKGQVDFLLAVDKQEGKSWQDNLKKNGIYFSNNNEVENRLTNTLLVAKLFYQLQKKNYIEKKLINESDIIKKLEKKFKDKNILSKNIAVVKSIFYE